MSEQDPSEAPPSSSKARAGFLTALGLAAIAGMLAMPVLAGPPAEGVLSQWGRFIGRFHPLLLHLPIGMLSLVLLLEFGKLFKKDKGSSTLVPAFLTAMFSVLAVIAGFLLYMSKPGEYHAELIDEHLWWGIGFACAMIATFVVKSWVDLADGRGNIYYLVMLLLSGGVMAVASHDGGSLTHGRSFLTEEMPDEVKPYYNKLPGVDKLKIESDGNGSQERGDEESSGQVVPIEEQVVYSDIVQPIFNQKCVSCHGEEKQKGKLRMDSYELLLAGGKEGEGFEPGNAEDSNIIFRIHLPEDDEEHMPPEGKKQMDAHELVILEWWINSGASPEARVGELEISEEVKTALGKLVPPEMLEALETASLKQDEVVR